MCDYNWVTEELYVSYSLKEIDELVDQDKTDFQQWQKDNQFMYNVIKAFMIINNLDNITIVRF